MNLSHEILGDIAVIKISGRLDATNSKALKDKFHSLLSSSRNYVMDLSEMNFIDSTGLGSMVSCLKNASEHDGEVKLACLQPKARMVFEITRAYRIFDIFDDVSTAVESYK